MGKTVAKILFSVIFTALVCTVGVACDDASSETYTNLEKTILADLIEEISQFELSAAAKQTLEEVLFLYEDANASQAEISSAISNLYQVKNELLSQPLTFIDGALEAKIKKALNLPQNALITVSDILYVKELDLSYTAEDEAAGFSKIRFVEDLSKFPSLKKLNLSSNAMNDFSGIALLTGLTDLDISFNFEGTEVSPDLSPIYSLSNLENLNISYNNVTDLSGVSRLEKLKSINISGNLIGNISELSVLKNLKSLTMRDMSVDFNYLKALPHIEVLDVTNTVFTTPADYSLFENILSLSISNVTEEEAYTINSVSLSFLSITNSDISNISFCSKLVNLSCLDLSGNKIQDISSISQLKNLVSLDLSNNLIEQAVFDDMPSIMSVNLSKNKIKTLYMSGDYPSLNKLDISENVLSNIYIKNAEWLTQLNAASNSLSDISFISEFVNMKNLDLSSNLFTESDFSQLTKLQTVNLSNSPLSSTNGLTSNFSITELDLSGTKITDLDGLSGKTSIKSLKIKLNLVSDYLPLSTLTGLEALEIYGMQKTEWNIFSEMTALKSFKIFSSSAKQPVLQNLPLLEYIEINGCSYVTDISQISDLPSLKELFINKVNVTNPVVRGFPSLKKLTITNGNIEYVSLISDLPSLEYLNLANNDFEALEFSMDLPPLRYVNLSSSRIYVIDDLNIKIHVGSLDLSGNYIKKITRLSTLFDELAYLDISKNRITDFSPLDSLVIGELVK